MRRDMAGVDRGLAGALAGSVQCLVLAKMTKLDRQSPMETYEDIQMPVRFLFVKKLSKVFCIGSKPMRPIARRLIS